MTDEDSRKDVARAVKQSWNLVILQMEVGIVVVIVAVLLAVIIPSALQLLGRIRYDISFGAPQNTTDLLQMIFTNDVRRNDDLPILMLVEEWNKNILVWLP